MMSANSARDSNHALEMLRSHGRSFHWAGQLLAPAMRARCARLYAICRTIDDTADNPVTDEAQSEAIVSLNNLIEAIRKRDSRHPVVAEATDLFADHDTAWRALEHLAVTALTDIGPVRIADEASLYAYADGVAGTVGIMMASMLNAEQGPDTRMAAQELGIAMQYTNIARDVLEDARKDRVYLPASWLGPRATPGEIVAGEPQARSAAWQAVQELLAHAEMFYQNGWQGLTDLPPRSRLAIAVASQVYRRIGVRIQARGPELYWQERCRVSTAGKLLASLHGLRLYRQAGQRLMSAIRSQQHRDTRENDRRGVEQ